MLWAGQWLVGTRPQKHSKLPKNWISARMTSWMLKVCGSQYCILNITFATVFCASRATNLGSYDDRVQANSVRWRLNHTRTSKGKTSSSCDVFYLEKRPTPSRWMLGTSSVKCALKCFFKPSSQLNTPVLADGIEHSGASARTSFLNLLNKYHMCWRMFKHATSKEVSVS